MKIYNNPNRKNWPAILQRPALDTLFLQNNVQSVLDDVKANGDEALRRYTLRFDKLELTSFAVTAAEIQAAANELPTELKQAINTAAKNIRTFHEKQLQQPQVIETMPGVQCWRKSVAIEKVGIYIPGGSAPLFSTVLMLAIPAAIAGCQQVVLCTPAQKNGSVHPAVLYSAQVCGVTQVYKVGGAQAIAAMAYGTETVPQVHKIFGPGNQYVTCAKQLVQMHGTAIDMPAGPSEVCVLADETANPAFVAADLLSQAEHGADSQVVLVTTSAPLAEQVQTEVAKQLEELPRKEIAEAALQNSRIIVMENLDEAIALVNEYAAEHLIIACKGDEAVAERVVNAGSVFLGNYSPESAGDYASGTNHTLPTNGFAKTYSGVSVDSFVKKITYQKISRQGITLLGPTVQVLANFEGLEGHARAVGIRI